MKACDVDIELQELLAEFVDGRLDASARQRLRDRLHDDADAQRLYLEICEVHAALAWEHGLVLADVAPQPSPSLSPRRRLAAVVGTLAATLLISLVWLNSENKEPAPPSGDVVATLTSRIDAVLTRDQVQWNEHEIRIGEYDLDRGLIGLEFASGVTVIVEAPSRLEFLSADHLILHSGRLSANVPPEGLGFTVETPEAEVVDFGTEFSVEVRAGESEVHVFGGLVRVQPKAGDGGHVAESVDLRTAQAVRITNTTNRPAGIDLATDRFIRSIEEPQGVGPSRKLGPYPRLVKRWKPVAYYRMAIRELGLACSTAGAAYSPEYAGEVLKGTGQLPAWAPGRLGESLRIGGRSLGRGGVVQTAPPLTGNAFSIAVWVRPESRPTGAIVVTDFDGDSGGRYALRFDPVGGHLQAVVRMEDGSLTEAVETEQVSLGEWHHVVMICDGRSLRMFRNGRVVASAPCHQQMAPASDGPCWIGTESSGRNLWEGRIDELAFFDRALTEKQVNVLFDAVKDLQVPGGQNGGATETIE